MNTHCITSCLLLVLSLTGLAHAQTLPQGVDAVVQDVIDGDTIRVRMGTVDETVRYIGFDAPELGRQPQCYAEVAKTANAQLVQGQTVRLESDRLNRDRARRLLRHVYLADGRLVGAELALIGAGFSRRAAPNVKRQPQIAAAQASAIREKTGLWNECVVNRAHTRTAFKPAPRAIVAVQPAAAQPEAAQPVAAATPAPEPLALQAPAPEPTRAIEPPAAPAAPAAPAPAANNCDPSYPTLCIPPGAPDLDCPDIPDRRFPVVGADPHRFDGDHDGIGCEK